jgi:lipoprotein signal peptidase
VKTLLLTVFLIVCDGLTKIFALHSVPPLQSGGYPFGGIGIFELCSVTFSLNLVTNTGAAWGMFQGRPGLLFVLRMAIILGLILYTLRNNRTFARSWPLWLIISGAIGNGIDYLAYGHVIDFFHFTFWGHSFAIFNLADSYISIGVLAMLLFPKRFTA